MGIESGLTNLLASGQNQQQPDLLKNYVGGMQIQQNNQNQQFRNNLLDRQFQMDERKFNRMEQQDQLEIDQNAKTDEAFGALMESWVPDNPQEERQKQSVMALYPSDKSGAFNHVFEQMKAIDPNIDPNDVVEMEGGGWALLQRNGPALPLSPPEGGQFAQKKGNAPWFSGNIGGNQFSMGSGAMPQNMGQTVPPNALGTDQNVQTLLQAPNVSNAPVQPKVAPDSVIQIGQGGEIRSQVIPGSDTEYKRKVEADALARELSEEDESTQKARSSTRDNSTAAIALIDDLIKRAGPMNTGAMGTVAGVFPFTGASGVESDIDTLKAEFLLDALAGLKSIGNGSTGMGPLSDREGAKLEARVTALDHRKPTYYDNLLKAKYHFERVLSRAKGIDPGEFDPNVYMDAPTRDEYLDQQVQSEAAKALQSATNNPLSTSTQSFQPTKMKGGAGKTLTATNPKTGEKVISHDGGMTWEMK